MHQQQLPRRLRVNGSTLLDPDGNSIRLTGFNWQTRRIGDEPGALMRKIVPRANVARIVGVLWDNSKPLDPVNDCYRPSHRQTISTMHALKSLTPGTMHLLERHVEGQADRIQCQECFRRRLMGYSCRARHVCCRTRLPYGSKCERISQRIPAEAAVCNVAACGTALTS